MLCGSYVGPFALLAGARSLITSSLGHLAYVHIFEMGIKFNCIKAVMSHLKRLTMRKVFATLAIVLFFTANSHAWQSYDGRSGSTYDAQTGNNYTWQKDYSGNTRVAGNNYQTGTMWNTNIQPNGNMSGMDSQQNYWNYNAQTKSYWNTNGKQCWGYGQNRQCN